MQKGPALSSSKGFAPVLIVLILAALAAGAGFLVYTNYTNNRTKTTPIQVQSTPTAESTASSKPSNQVNQPPFQPCLSGTTNEMKGWKAYVNTKYCYTFSYPSDYLSESKLYETQAYNKDYGITIYTPDAKLNKYGGWIISGTEIRIGAFLDPQVFEYEAETMAKTNNPVEIDNTIIPSNLKLPKGVTYIAFIQKRGPFINADFTYDLPSPNNGTKELIQFSCVGEVQECKIILPKILSTFKFLP